VEKLTPLRWKNKVKNLAANENPGQEEQLSGERFNLIKAFHKFQLTQCLRLGACNTFSKEKNALANGPEMHWSEKRKKGVRHNAISLEVRR